MIHFNRLTPAEAERLALLAEECAEVIQVVGKVLRHGYESHNPVFDADQSTNRQLLQKELGDLRAATRLMIRETDVSESEIARAYTDKTARVGRWLHHQG